LPQVIRGARRTGRRFEFCVHTYNSQRGR
jgi:hypothetical protein